MEEFTIKYDYVGNFQQGVAIVVKNSAYGVILMGGHEIIPPSYDYISPFSNGYAKAIRNGQCKLIDLSGQECMMCNGKLIAIPKEYDCIREFSDGIACVSKNGLWGAIDSQCNEIYSPQFYYLSDFIKGTAKYIDKSCNYANCWGILNVEGYKSECHYMEPEILSDGTIVVERDERIVNADGHVYVDLSKNPTKRIIINNKEEILLPFNGKQITLSSKYSIARGFKEGLSCVQDQSGYWGVVNTTGKEIFKPQFLKVTNFINGRAFATNRKNDLCIINSVGQVVATLAGIVSAEPFENGYSIISNGKHLGLMNTTGKILIPPIAERIEYVEANNEFKLYKGTYKGLYQISTNSTIAPEYDSIIDVISESITVSINGIGEFNIDKSGKVVVKNNEKSYILPDWCIGGKIIEEELCFVVNKDHKVGIIDLNDNTILCQPIFDAMQDPRNGLADGELTITSFYKKIKKYGAYNIKTRKVIPANYDAPLILDNNYYIVTSGGVKGVLDESGMEIVTPKFVEIYYESGYFIVSLNKENYSGIKTNYGVLDLSGNFITPIVHERICVLQEGLFKVLSEGKWCLHSNDYHKITGYIYDEINKTDQVGIFSVKKEGVSFKINEKGNAVVKDEEGNYVVLPSKYTWGNDFVNGVAEVCVSGFINHIDKNLNLIILKDGIVYPVDPRVDYIISKNYNGTYTFSTDGKVGVMSSDGKIIIDAIYHSINIMSDSSYAASIEEEQNDSYEGYKLLYGVIDWRGNIIIPFFYRALRPFTTKASKIELMNSQKLHSAITNEESANSKYWIVCDSNMFCGLIDKNGTKCLPPVFSEIEWRDGTYYVKEKGEFGIYDSEFNPVIPVKYNTLNVRSNGFLEISVLSELGKRTFGILDKDGNEILAPIYDYIGVLNFDGAASEVGIIKKDNLYGLVDSNYRIIAEPVFTMISEFSEGKANAEKIIRNEDSIESQSVGVLLSDGTYYEVSIKKIIVEQPIDAKRKDIIENINSNNEDNNTDDSKKTSLKTVSDTTAKDAEYVISSLTGKFNVIQRKSQSPIEQQIKIVNDSGDIVLPYKYHRIEPLANGHYRVFLRTGYDGFYGILDSEFNEILPASFKNISVLDNLYISSNESWLDRSESYGAYDFAGRNVLPHEYDTISQAKKGLLYISKKEKTGLATKDGTVILTPQFGKIEAFMDNFALVNDGYWYDEEDDDYPYKSREYSYGLWGVVDENGTIILPPKYSKIEYQQENHIFNVIWKDWQYKEHIGIFNSEGEKLVYLSDKSHILMSDNFDWQEDFDDQGLSKVYKNGKIGFVNEQNVLQIKVKVDGEEKHVSLPNEYSWGYDSEYDSYIVESNNKKGVLNSKNEVLLEVLYDSILPICTQVGSKRLFICGIAETSSNTTKPSIKYGIYEEGGKCILDAVYQSIKSIGRNLYAAQLNAGEVYILNDMGEVIDSNPYQAVFDFGQCSISSYNSYSYYNYNRREEIAKQIKEEANHAIVKKDGLYGAINMFGNIEIPIRYKSLELKPHGLFLADSKIIDSKCNEVITDGDFVIPVPKDCDKLTLLAPNIYLVQKGEKVGCVNMLGHTIIPIEYSHIELNGELFIVYCCEGSKKVVDMCNNVVVDLGQDVYEIKIEDGLIKYRIDNKWGLYTYYGKKVCEPLYDYIEKFSKNLYKVGTERYYYTNYHDYIDWGLIDSNGNEVLPIEYRLISNEPKAGLFEISRNKEVGYIDASGNILIDAQYKSIGDFKGGYAIVSRTYSKYDYNRGRDVEVCRYGIINSQFEEIVPCRYSELRQINTSIFNTEYGMITAEGNCIANVNGHQLVISSKYKCVKEFVDGHAIAVKEEDFYNTFFGLIDDEGNDILPPIFDKLEYLGDGLIKYCLRGLFGLMDDSGNIILENKYNTIGKFEEDGIACVAIKANVLHRNSEHTKYGFIDRNGQIVIPAVYDFIGKRQNGYAVVMTNNFWRLFDVNKRTLLQIQNSSYIGPVVDNVCKYNVGGRFNVSRKEVVGGIWGYMDINGNSIIPPTYEYAYNFSEDIAAVKKDGRLGFIKKNGEILVPLEYDELIKGYKDGIGKLCKDDVVYEFNKDGKVVSNYDVEHEDEYDYPDYGDDTSSIYDNPYYNDNLDMDQQSIDFWNSIG